jgi:hypothetical protein
VIPNMNFCHRKLPPKVLPGLVLGRILRNILVEYSKMETGPI